MKAVAPVSKIAVHGSLAVSSLRALEHDPYILPVNSLNLNKWQPPQRPSLHKFPVLQFPAHGHQLLVELLYALFIELRRYL